MYLKQVDVMGGMMVEWVALLSLSSRLPGLIIVCMEFLCMFFTYLCGFFSPQVLWFSPSCIKVRLKIRLSEKYETKSMSESKVEVMVANISTVNSKSIIKLNM